MAPALNLPAPAHGADNTLASTSAPSSFKIGATGGIIYPPPQLRRTIDKAAKLIAKKDPSFEANIKAAEANNPKFAFLKEDDAYHTYYASRRDAVRRGDTLTPLADQHDPSSSNAQAASSAQGADPQAGPSTQPPPQPEPFEFSADLPNITAVDLDVLKLTALFTARKARSFATSLLARESKSYQFEFLRPTHSLFTYFNHLVEQYQKVISPSPALLERVQLGAYGTTDAQSVAQQRTKSSSSIGTGRGGARPQLLEQVKARAEWEKYTREQRKKQDHDDEKQRQAFNEIDWQDFVVVGTVQLTETDQHVDLPPPRSLREMENMTLAQKKMQSMIMETEAAGGGDDDDDDVEEMVMPGRPSSSAVPAVQEVPNPSGKAGTIKVRKDYVPRGLASRAKPASAATTKCPVCGGEVPIDEMAEHVRFELLNPAYREQRQQFEAKKAQQATLPAGADPTYYLKQLATARDDEDEDARLRREAEERRLAKEKEKIIWDGHAKSIAAAREMIAKNVGLEQEMLRVSGKPVQVLPEYGPQFPDMEGAAQEGEIDGDDGPITLPKGSSLPSKPVDSANVPAPEPSSSAGVKRPAETDLTPPPPRPAPQPSASTLAKKGDGTLHPENTWLEANASKPAVTITLTLPDREEPYEAALKSTIATLRDYVHQDLFNSAVAASKIKIKVNGKPATLKQTLAYWNLQDGDHVAIELTR